MKKIILASLVLPSLFATSSAFAFGGGDAEQCNLGGEQAMLKKLDLSQEQQQRIAQVQQEYLVASKARIVDNMKIYQKALQDMNAITYADKFDEAAATKVATQAAQIRIKNQVEQSRGRHDLLQVLTPKQRSQFKTMVEKNAKTCLSDLKEKTDKLKKALEAMK